MENIIYEKLRGFKIFSSHCRLEKRKKKHKKNNF